MSFSEGLRHERGRDPVEEGDLLDAVLVDRVPVGRGDRVGVAGVHLVLAVPGLALGELDRDPAPCMPRRIGTQVRLVHRGGEDVVVEDVRDRRGEAAVVLLVRLGVALLVEVELELGGEVRHVAHLAGALVLGDQHLPRRGDDRRAVVVGDVADHERGPVEPRDPPQRGDVGDDREVPVARPPSWPSRSRGPGPSPCRGRAGSCSPRSGARAPRRGSTRPGSACRTAAPACR